MSCANQHWPPCIIFFGRNPVYNFQASHGTTTFISELLQYAVRFNQHIPSFDDDPRSLYTLTALEHPEIACIKLKLNPQVVIFPDQQTS